MQSLLAVARSEGGVLTPAEIDLAEIVGDVVGELAAAAGPVRFDLVLDTAIVRGDRFLLERCAANLIENAVRYNVPGGWVRIQVRSDGDRASLEVTNPGVRMTKREAARLLEPFVRRPAAAGTTGGGMGLGLSIARAIVKAHSGKIQARPRRDGGLEVGVGLPVDFAHTNPVGP